jgi:hypothetical protein
MREALTNDLACGARLLFDVAATDIGDYRMVWRLYIPEPLLLAGKLRCRIKARCRVSTQMFSALSSRKIIERALRPMLSLVDIASEEARAKHVITA